MATQGCVHVLSHERGNARLRKTLEDEGGSLPLSDNAEPKSAVIDPTVDEDSNSTLIEFFKLLDKCEKERPRKIICDSTFNGFVRGKGEELPSSRAAHPTPAQPQGQPSSSSAPAQRAPSADAKQRNRNSTQRKIQLQLNSTQLNSASEASARSSRSTASISQAVY